MTTQSETQPIRESAPEDIYSYLLALIRQATRQYLSQTALEIEPEQLPFNLQFSAQNTFGDYSMPVMAWSSKKLLGRPPFQIAEALADLLTTGGHRGVQEITVTKPGYLNFRLDRPEMGRAIIARVHDAGANFGQSKIGTGVKYLVEHTAINSNKAAHVGHLRNSCLGDTVVRMLRSQGYEVEVDNYIDNTGVQVADVVVGLFLIRENKLEIPGGNEQLPDESFDYYCSRVYVAVGKAYETDPELLKRRNEVLHSIEHEDETGDEHNYAAFAEDLSQKIVRYHLNTMARLNISYDLLTWESAIIGAGLWQHVFERLKTTGLLEHPESGKLTGCWILPFGDEKADDAANEDEDHSSDKVLVKSNGTATYTAKDIANQAWKFGLTDDMGVEFHFIPWAVQHDGRTVYTMRSRLKKDEEVLQGDPRKFGHANRVVNVIDTRQSYPQQVVYESLRRLGYVDQSDNSKHLSYEVVTLSAATARRLGIDTSDGREFYAMSGRKGLEIKADDLINIATERMQENKEGLSPETAEVLAASAIRYFMIRFGLQQVITLDMDEVLRPNGDTGVYIQYAYARANSILRRLQEAGYTMPEYSGELPSQLDQSEWELLRHIDAYPRTLADTSAQLAPNTLSSYVYDLAAHFSDFYEHTTPILREENPQVKAFRASLVRTTVQTMGNAMRVLGFIPLDRI